MKRIVLVLAMTVAVAAALFAQRGPGGPGGPRGGGDLAAALKTQLGLTDAQVTAITALAQAEQTRMQAIRTEVEQKRQVLDTLLNAASPVPVDVGNAAIALRASEAKIKAEQDYFISQIKQELTGEQQQKLDALLASGRGIPIPGLGPGPGGRGGGPR